ncbi:uncharacterized protein MONOS_12617 [Monocercomonoides exilis]|uniref:uncharacterized protein n=1 Tax=Monocercomonoides exilis TaxID=2049356 RepID=UPI00355AA319|nr:hypothetical protein MONOS_12617 [Monocercomonoides exilis]|eukprot:MONOS_12617.1-p1 / transcript=MONOS_12617.1 / gene=MONOS_12617 / organism=Monocercomonoides_exilis_PA203 / gene_product=unspecified product / transcript_product=unspecified product / location=Mono_scaffold00710:4464-5042(-) / protein_length=146 / sequence_SO=supercontig / SO=protein_coding / is_pseudo=false
MRIEETKNKNMDKICHLQSLMKEKKNEEQEIRVLRKGGEEGASRVSVHVNCDISSLVLAPPPLSDPQHAMNMFSRLQQEKPTRILQANIECALYILCAVRKVDTNLFYVLNENWIVYDGRLSVDEKCATNDLLILAWEDTTEENV